jgi:hypothetical protein
MSGVNNKDENVPWKMRHLQRLYPEAIYSFHRVVHEFMGDHNFTKYGSDPTKKLVTIQPTLFSKHTRTFHWAGVGDWKIKPQCIICHIYKALDEQIPSEVIGEDRRKALESKWKDFYNNLIGSRTLEKTKDAANYVEQYIKDAKETISSDEEITALRHVLTIYEGYHHDPRLYLDGIVYRNLENLHRSPKGRTSKIEFLYGELVGDEVKTVKNNGKLVITTEGNYKRYKWVKTSFSPTAEELSEYQCQEINGIDGNGLVELTTAQIEKLDSNHPGLPIALQLTDSIFFKHIKTEYKQPHVLVLPLYDVCIGEETWGSLCGNLVLFFVDKKALNKFIAIRSKKPGETLLGKLRDKSQRIVHECNKSGTLLLLSQPIKPPYNFVDHFVKNLNILQDWERIIVYKDVKPLYSYQWGKKNKAKEDEPEWMQNEWKRCDCGKSTSGNVSCAKCPPWEEVEKDVEKKYLHWEYDFWDSSFLPDISDEEKSTFGGIRLAFEYPITACIPDDANQRKSLGEEYIRQQLEVLRGLMPKVRARRAALRSAVSAIMGRNMSHNIGSHVLARYSSAIKQDLDPANKDKTDHRTDFMNYLQRRMDFLAEVATSDKAFWEQPLSLHETINKLNYDTQTGQIKEDKPCSATCSQSPTTHANLDCSRQKAPAAAKKNRPILLSYITGKESLLASVEYGKPEYLCPGDDNPCQGGYVVNKKQNDFLFSCPGGEVGVHALYVILENIIRNSARHAKSNSDKKNYGDERVEVFVSVNDSFDAKDKVSDGFDAKDNLIKLTIIDPRTKLDKGGWVMDESNETEVKSLTDRINYILTKEPFLNEDGSTNPKYWGVREMQICANYLRGFPLADLEGMPESPLVLEAKPWPYVIDIVTEYYLSYTLYLKQAQLLAYIETSSQSENTDHRDKRDKELLLRGIKPIYRDKVNEKDKDKAKEGNEIVDWQKIANASRGYSFLVLTPDLMTEYEKKLQPEAVAENPSEKQPSEPGKVANESQPKENIKHALPVRIVEMNNDIYTLLGNLMPKNGEAKADADGEPDNESEQPSEATKKVDLWSLHEAMIRKYRTNGGAKKVRWGAGNIYAVAAWEGTENNCECIQIPPGEKLYYCSVNTASSNHNTKPFSSLPKELAVVEDDNTPQHLGLAWLDHANDVDLMCETGGTPVSASLICGGARNWASVEPLWSDSPHRQVLTDHSPEGMREIAAAALARVVVLDERIQSRRHDKVRDVTLYKYWPQAGIWCPLHPDDVKKKIINGDEQQTIVKNGDAYHDINVACNLDEPGFAEIHGFLKTPTEVTYQYPADFLVLHLTILERLHKQSPGKCINKVLSELVRGTPCEHAQIIIVTGRGVPTVAFSREGEEHIDARYLPISALQEFLVTRPSKLGLMRVLWAAAAPGKQ